MISWKDLRLYGTFNLGYFGFLVGYLFIYVRYGDAYKVLYDLFLFYFDAPYENFIAWFPTFYWALYAGCFLLKIVFAVACLSIVILVSRLLIYSRGYNYYSSHVHCVRTEGAVLMLALTFYLLLYVGLRLMSVAPLFDDLQVLVARGFLLHLLLQIVLVLLTHGKRCYHYLKRFLLTPQLPYNIAILRILFFSYLIFLYLVRLHTALPTVSLSTKVGLPLIGWLVEMMPVNSHLYIAFVVLGVTSCLFIVAGFKTRFFLVVNAICCFYIFATPNFFGRLAHHQLVIWISWFFALSRCYDVFSIDSKQAKRPIVKKADYTYPVRLIWIQLGVIYFWAGFYKLWDSGFDWALGSSMINQVQLEWLQHYDRIPTIRIDQYPLILHVGGLVVILFELGYILSVLKPKWRWVAATRGILMHNLAGYFLYISFFHLLQVFYVIYIDFNKLFSSSVRALEAKTINTFSRYYLGMGVVILGANFFCGMFSVDSYPFSAYPKYSALIPDRLKYIRFEAYMGDHCAVDAHSVGKDNNFRWESYGWLEYRLIRGHEAGEDVSNRMESYWEIWCAYNSQLLDFDSVTVTIVERPVAPEGIREVTVLERLETIRPVGH